MGSNHYNNSILHFKNTMAAQIQNTNNSYDFQDTSEKAVISFETDDIDSDKRGEINIEKYW